MNMPDVVSTNKEQPKIGWSEGSVGSSSPRYSLVTGSISEINELIDMVGTVEILDGVRANLQQDLQKSKLRQLLIQSWMAARAGPPVLLV